MKKLVRSVGVASAALAFGAGAALSAPVAGAQSSLPTDSLGGSLGGETCGTEVVTPENQEASGWSSPDDENSAAIAAVEDAPEHIGDAALEFESNEAGTSLYKNANETALTDLLLNGEELVPISFDYTSNGQAPALQIRLNGASLDASESDEDGYDVGFATIVWSPEAADGTTWQEATPGNTDQYWVTRSLSDGEGGVVERGERMTLQQIIDLNADAVVTDYGIQKTRDNTSPGAAIDNFTLGCETTNFELEAEDTGSLGDAFGSLEDMLPS